MHTTLIDFITNRVEYMNPSHFQDNYCLFQALYSFINPFIPQIKKMIIEDDGNAKIYPITSMSIDNMKTLIDKSSVDVSNVKYKAITSMNKDYIRLKLMSG